MTHAALTNAALFVFLVFMTVLLVTFVGAVIAAPPASPVPEADPPLTVQALARAAQPPSPPPPLPRRRPLATASAAGAASWSADADAASPSGAAMPAYTRVDPLQVSGGPPWGPAPKPPGPDPWTTEDFSPGQQLWPGQRPVSPNGAQPTNREPPAGTRALPDNQTPYPRHARDRNQRR